MSVGVGICFVSRVTQFGMIFKNKNRKALASGSPGLERGSLQLLVMSSFLAVSCIFHYRPLVS